MGWLERQLHDLSAAPAATPVTPSNLTAPPIEAETVQSSVPDSSTTATAPRAEENKP